MATRNGRTIPSRTHLETCKRLGIPVSPTMSNRDVYLTIQKQSKNRGSRRSTTSWSGSALTRRRKQSGPSWDRSPTAQSKMAQALRPEQALRGRVPAGVPLNGTCWNSRKFRRTTAAWLRFESRCCAPKRRKERDTGEYLEWEKEIKLKPENILRFRPCRSRSICTTSPLTKKLLGVCARWAEKFD